MKTSKTLLVRFLLLLCVLSFIDLNAQYCTPQNIGVYDDWTFEITKVRIGSINNNSSGSIGAYTYYSSVSSTDINAGETLTGNVRVKMNGWNTDAHTIVVWLNFNSDDDDFEDSGERFLFPFQDNNSSGGKKHVTVPISIPIPTNVQNGLSRMRVGLINDTGTSFSSCDYSWRTGEVEDYNVNFIGGTSNPGETEPNFCDPVNIGNSNALYISNVSIAGIDNSSTGSTGGFTYYSGVAAGNVPVGETLTGNVEVTLDGWNSNANTIYVWMNFNENSDDDFEDLGERFSFPFAYSGGYVPGTTVVNVPISIPIPSTADEALSKIRIGVRGGGVAYDFTSCDYDYKNGEVEDYLINIGDGIPDSTDLDSDNDGILDVDEGAACNEITQSLSYEFYDINVSPSVDNIPTTGVTATGSVSEIDVDALWSTITPSDHENFAIRYSGFITINTEETYTFYTSSDDGSKLFIDGNQVVDNDGDHSMQEISGNIALSPGVYSIAILFYERTGDEGLTVSYSSSTISKTLIPFTVLSEINCMDIDNDGIPNYLDLDSDNDGIYDIDEAGNGSLDTNNDGMIDNNDASYNDNNNNGVDDTAEATSPIDTSGDGIFDFLNIDSDGDGCNDVIEAGHLDSNSDGQVDGTGVDANGLVAGASTSYTGTNANVTTAVEVTVNATGLEDQLVAIGAGTSFTITSAIAKSTTTFTTDGEPDYSSNYTDVSAGLSYQWQLNGTNLVNGGVYTGVTSASLNISDVTGLDGSAYTLVVTHVDNSCIQIENSATLYLDSDTDGDGVGDSTDLDIDNDGILNVDEGAGCNQVTQSLSYEFYDMNVMPSVDNIPTSGATATGSISEFDVDALWQMITPGDDNTFAIRYTGFIKINTTETYTFYTTSDDGSKLFINGDEVVDNDGEHSSQERFGTIDLTPGYHSITILFYENGGYESLSVSYSSSTISKTLLPFSILTEYNCTDTDNDGVADIYDLDNDNDGIPNVVELGLIDDNLDGTVYGDSTNPWVDANGNGVHDAYESVVPIDTDGDGVPDYLDLDSDNDGIFDSVEYDGYGDIDITGNGVGDGQDYEDGLSGTAGNNQDGDGILPLLDDYDGHGTLSYTLPVDTDGDGIPDYLDLFSNDPTNDIANGSDIGNTIYAHLDTNNDGVISGSADTDGDGIVDEFDTDNSVFGSPRDLVNGSYSILFDGRNDYIEEASNVIQGLSKVTQMAWVKIDADFSSTGAIIGQENSWIRIDPQRRIRFYDSESTSVQAPSSSKLEYNKWTHIAVVYDGLASEETSKIYINGEQVASGGTASGSIPFSSDPKFRIGRKPFDSGSQLYFKGEIDEVRIFNTSLTEEEIQKIVYQELDENENFNQGKIIPKAISENNIGNNLIRYYKMDSFKDDILDNKVTSSIDETAGATIYNVKNLRFQTAPLPYRSIQDGDWTSESTWEHGDVWDISDINNDKYWNIVEIDNEVSLSESYSSTGLLVDSNGILNIEGDNFVNNSWYLKLDGTIDLKGDSQLIQTDKSDLVTSATGKIKRRQEGTSSFYWYNYWASPVGSLGVTSLTDNNSATNNINNSEFSLSMLKKGDGSSFEFTNSYHELGKISRYWLYKYINGVTYYDWLSFDENDVIGAAVGYIQKGTGVSGAEQEYLFEGKPNNGTIIVSATDTGGDGSVPAVSQTKYLLGNPYPSAIDLHKFIDDNAGVISGTIQLWQQWSGSSHMLNEYNGGYAQVNKLGSIRAYQFVGIEGANNGSQDGTKTPSRYIPVGQGFEVEIVSDGNVVFQNSQRVFVKESDADGSYNNGSVFFRGNNSDISKSINSGELEEEIMRKMRIEFNSVDGPATKRELLLGFSNATSDDFDYGYDAKNSEGNSNDLYTSLNGDPMTIQAFGEITNDKVVPLILKSSGDYNYTIKLTEIENVDDSQDIFIKDNLTNEYYDLRSEQPFEFSTETGEFANRFEIVFQDDSSTLSQIDQEIESINFYYANARQRLVILNPNYEKIKGVNVVDMLGKTVNSISYEFNSSYNEFSLSNLSTGVYIVQVVTEGNGSVSKKIIVE